MHGYKLLFFKASYVEKKYLGSYFSEMIKEFKKRGALEM